MTVHTDTFGRLIAEHLGLDPTTTVRGSLAVEWTPDTEAVITWTGAARLDLPTLSRLFAEAQAQDNLDDARTDAL